MNEQHVDDLLDLYALGAAEPQEQATIEAHLQVCERCRAQLSEAQRVTELLAWTPDQYDPPAYLHERVRQRVATLQRAEQVRQPTFWQRLGHAFQPPAARWGWALSGVMLALALVLGARTWQLQQQLDQVNAQLEQANTLIAQQEEVLDVVQSPGVQVASLTPTDTSGPQAQLFFDAQSERALLVAQNLPPLQPDQTYQFWLIAEQPVSGGLFTADPQGQASLLVEAQQPLETYQAVGISIEPAGGSPTPTQDAIVLLGPL